MHKIIYTLFLIIGCTDIPRYQGPVQRIVCLTSKEDMPYVKSELKSFFSDTIFTPQAENKYDILFRDFLDLNDYKFHSNIIIASIESPLDSTVDLYTNRYRDRLDSTYSIFNTDDAFTKNQSLLCMFYKDSLSLSIGLSSNEKWIKSKIDERINKNNINRYIGKSQNDSIKSLIIDLFNLEIIVHTDYKVLGSGSDYLWIGRGTPYRWIIFQDIDSNYKSNFSSIENKVNELSYIDIIDKYRHIDKRSIDTKSVDFFRGVYETDETGGPFISYVIRTNNKNILVSSFVNNPGFDKLPILIQQEAIIENMKIME